MRDIQRCYFQNQADGGLKVKKRYLLLGFVVLAATQPASAYLDPGAGSFIWQMLIGIVLGAAFILKMYWQKTKSFFKNLLRNEHEQD